MVALCNRADHYIFILSFVLLLLLSSPNLSRRRLDVCHTCITWCGSSANLRCRSETCCTRLAEKDAKSRQKSPFGHHRTNLSGYIFATKACIDNPKKFLSSNISSTCSHNMANFGPLAAKIGSVVWDIPGNFNGFRVLAVLLHGTPAVGVSQTLRRGTEGATYIRQGDHHVGHWPTF